MAMKFRVTKTELEKLAPHYQSEYIEKDGAYILDVEGGEDTGALKRAKDREKAARIAAETKLNEVEGELDTLKSQKVKNEKVLINIDKFFKEQLIIVPKTVTNWFNHMDSDSLDIHGENLLNKLSEISNIKDINLEVR